MTYVPTHYDNLKVAQNAPVEVIRAAYRVLAKMYHPDLNSSPDAPRVMALINEARRVLGDPVLRAAHDAWIASQWVDVLQARPLTIQQSPAWPSGPGRSAREVARRRFKAARTFAGKTLYAAIALALLGGQTWLLSSASSGMPSRFELAEIEQVEDSSMPAPVHAGNAVVDRYAQAESDDADRRSFSFQELAAPGAAAMVVAHEPVVRHVPGGQASTAPIREPSPNAGSRLRMLSVASAR